MRVLPAALALAFLFMFCALFPATARAACSSPAGAAADIIYSSTQKIMQYCDGTNWQRMSEIPGSGSGGCTGPVAVEGTMIYNIDNRVMQVCAGNVWRPMGPVGGSLQWLQVSASTSHTCAVRSDNKLFCWGTDAQVQLGNGAGVTADQAAPYEVTGGNTWKQVTVGTFHTCAIRSDDKLFCWGSDGSGVLGNGAGVTVAQPAPYEVTGGSTWKSVSSGASHACAVRSDDKLFCWGSDTNGRLGNGAGVTGNQPDPYEVTGGSTWKSVAVAEAHTCAIRSDDKLFCWGQDFYTQLGNGAGVTADQPSPYEVTGGNTWKMVSAGIANTCAIRSDDKLFCWGSDASGQIGNGAGVTGNQPDPYEVTGGSTWKSVTVGNSFVCAVRSDDKLFCWGSDSSGTIGNGTGVTASQPDPYEITTPASSWRMPEAGNSHVCAITGAGQLYCWGSNLYTMLGSGSDYAPSRFSSPAQITGFDQWKVIEAGSNHTCGIRSDDKLFCWGNDANGKLGNGAGATVNQATPNEVTGGSTWKSVSVGVAYTCAIRSDNRLFCWGRDNLGQLGNGAAVTATQHDPYEVTGGSTWKKVSVTSAHSCAIRSDDRLFCWGWDNGALGNGAAVTAAQPDPYEVTGGSTWLDISAGEYFTCGIRSDSKLFCWGEDGIGQLGNGAGVTATQHDPYEVVGGSTWKQVSAGKGDGIGSVNEACALRSDNKIFCWGDDSSGQLGNGPVVTANQPAPYEVVGGIAWKTVSAGGFHACGISEDNKSLCWGSFATGQIGTGYDRNFHTPSATVCGNPEEMSGIMIYNTDNNVLQYCDGAGWVKMGR